MTYYILRDGTVEQRAKGCLQSVIFLGILIAVFAFAIGAKNRH